MLKREKVCFRYTIGTSTVENASIRVNAWTVIRAHHSQWHLSWTTTDVTLCLFANMVWLISGVSCWRTVKNTTFVGIKNSSKQDSLCPAVTWSASTGSKTTVHLSWGASEGDGTQSRCLSVLVNSPLKKERKRKTSQRGSETRTASTVIGETSPSQVSRSLCPERRPTMKHISINSVLSMTLFSKLTLWGRTSKQQNPALLPHRALHKILIISLAKAGKGSFPTTEPTNYLS